MKLIPKLIPDWKDAWRWFSAQALAAITFLASAGPLVWTSLPEDIKAHLPAEYGVLVLGVLAALGLLGRLVDQK